MYDDDDKYTTLFDFGVSDYLRRDVRETFYHSIPFTYHSIYYIC